MNIERDSIFETRMVACRNSATPTSAWPRRNKALLGVVLFGAEEDDDIRNFKAREKTYKKALKHISNVPLTPSSSWWLGASLTFDHGLNLQPSTQHPYDIHPDLLLDRLVGQAR